MISIHRIWDVRVNFLFNVFYIDFDVINLWICLF